MNVYGFVGRVTQELQQFGRGDGATSASFNAMVPNFRVSKKDENGYNSHLFMKVIAFGRNAEMLISKRLEIGDWLAVSGRLETDNYTKKSGEKVFAVKCVAETVDFIMQPGDKRERWEEQSEKVRRLDEPDGGMVF